MFSDVSDLATRREGFENRSKMKFSLEAISVNKQVIKMALAE